MNSYELSRLFFDWSFENPSKVTPNHIALYFFCIEHCNRLGWKKEFGLPTTMVKEAIGIRSYNTYINTLNDLVEFGFIKMIEKSKNQYSSNIIALSKFDKAHNKALDKALIKHTTKQSESTIQSIDSIDKQETINNKPNNKEQFNYKQSLNDLIDDEDLVNDYLKVRKTKKATNTKTAFIGLVDYCTNNNYDLHTAVKKMVENSWVGFKIEWINNLEKQNLNNGISKIGTTEKEPTYGGFKQSEVERFFGTKLPSNNGENG